MSKNHTNTSVYYLLFVKEWTFILTLRKTAAGLAKIGPARLFPPVLCM